MNDHENFVPLFTGILAVAASFAPGLLKLLNLLGEFENDWLITHRPDGQRRWRKVRR